MKLRQLLYGADISYMNADPDAEVKDVVNHSDKAEKGTVFAALRGEREDGYGYIKNALERGCDIILCDRMPYLPCGCIVTENAHKVYAQMCAAYYGDPQKKLKTFAVTGTNGKTTTTHILHHVFGKIYGKEKTALIGGVNNVICGIKTDAEMTTPDPHDLYRLLSDAAEGGAEYAFLEASSHSLDYEKLAPFGFKVGIFTNLTEDHLDHHVTMDSYFGSKKKLIPLCEKFLANNDDDYTKTLDCLKFSLYDGDFTAKDVKLCGDGSEFLYSGISSAAMKISLPGLFNVYNALCAAAAAELSGVSPGDFASAISDFRGAEGRFERVKRRRGASVIIDYAHTPDALLSALKAARYLCKKGKLWCVFGCGGDRDAKKRPVMGKIASENADVTVITSDNCRSEDPDAIIKDIMQGFDKEKRYIIIKDRREAIICALRNTGEGDAVLLAGKGHEKYEIRSDGKHPFSERDIIKEFDSKGTE